MMTTITDHGVTGALGTGIESFAESLRRELAPIGVLEGFFVDRMILSAQRLHQAALVEPTSAAEARSWDLCEAKAERTLARSYSSLKKLQADRHPRRGRTIPPYPARLAPDVATDSSGHEKNSDWPVAGQPDAPPSPTDPEAGDRWQDRLVFDHNISDTSPVVQGTWVTVNHIVSLVVDGWAWADILRSHPELTKADIRACLAYTIEEEGGLSL